MFTTRQSSVLEQGGSDPYRRPEACGLTFQLRQSSSTQVSTFPATFSLLSGHQQQLRQRSGAHISRVGRGTGLCRTNSNVNPLQAFAVLSGSRLFGIRHDGSIRHTFNKIDVDQKGHITEADLATFAESHSLPSGYVRPFLDAVLQHQQQQQQHEELGAEQQQQQQYLQADSEDEVSFDAFRAFVQSRESGLRQAFDAFDIDGDGRISPEDLCCSLSRVAICCPGGCVLRPRREVVAELMQRLNMDGGRRLTFPEFRNFFMLLPEQGQLVEYWLSGPAALSCADMGGHFSLQETHRQRRGSPWGHLLAGAVAGAASRSATAPLETLRLAAMAGHLPAGTSLWAAAQQLVAAGGVGALYKGNLVNVLRSAPARAVDFFAFDLFKTWVGSDTYPKIFAAAGLAGTFSWVLLYPLEVVRSRITLSSRKYAGIGHCMSTMLAAEGAGAFYRGLGASVAAIAPEAAITYGLHDLLKRRWRNTHASEPGVVPSLLCGVIASWSGQLVAFPLETVSRRMQMAGAAAAAGGAAATAAVAAPVPAGAAASTAATAAAAVAGGSGGGAAGTGMLHVLNSVLREGGPRALYRGLGAATLRLVPSAMISFGAYELIQKLWLELEAKQHVQVARSHYQQLHAALSTAQRCNQHIQELQQQGLSLVAAAAGSAGCAPCALQQETLLALNSSCYTCEGTGSTTSGSSSSSGVHEVSNTKTPCGMLACSSGCDLSAADAAAAISTNSSSSGSSSSSVVIDGVPAAPVAPSAVGAAAEQDKPCSTSSAAATGGNGSSTDGSQMPVAAPTCGVCVVNPPPGSTSTAQG